MRERNYSFDLLRGIAAFGIVACHLGLSPMTSAAWNIRWTGDMFVGLFAAMSGYLMNAPEPSDVRRGTMRSWLDYAKTRAARLLIPYAVWSVVYVLFGLVFDYFMRHSINPKWANPHFVTSVIFQGNASAHLWFLICLFYGQTILGLLIRITVNRKPLLWLPLGLLLLFFSLKWDGAWFATYPLRLFAFLVSGYWLKCKKYKLEKIKVSYICLLLMIMLFVHCSTRSFIHAFARDWLVVMPLLTLATKVQLPERLSRVWKVLGGSSMAVFLIHPIVAAGMGVIVRKIVPAPFGSAPLLVDWLLVWSASVMLSFVLLRMRFLAGILK